MMVFSPEDARHRKRREASTVIVLADLRNEVDSAAELIDLGGTGCRALLCKLHDEAAGCRLNPNCARSCGRSRRFSPAPERPANEWRRRRRWNGCGRVSPNSVIRMLRLRCNSRCPTNGRAIYFSRYAGVTG